MKLIATTVAVLSLLCLGTTVSAQEYEELERFSEEAGGMSMLFRGKQGMSYSFPYNGTYYWYIKDFLPGEVFYNGKLYPGAFINVNAHLQELLVKQNEDYLPVLVDTDHVDWFTMGGRRFVTRDYAGLPSLPEGFFEVLFDGRSKLYKRVDKFLRKDSTNRNGAGIGYDDPNYDDRIPDYFQNRVSYYFVKDGEIRSVKRWRELVSAYPGIKKDLKRYAKSVKDEYSRFDVLAPAILKYAEGNE